jgi:hypothetical protein
MEDVDFADLAEEVMGNINDDDNGIIIRFCFRHQ